MAECQTDLALVLGPQQLPDEPRRRARETIDVFGLLGLLGLLLDERAGGQPAEHRLPVLQDAVQLPVNLSRKWQ